MSPPRRAVALGGAAVLGVAAGLALARRLSPRARLNRLLNGNLRMLSSSERAAVAALAADPARAHLLRGWPAPGVADAAKRALVAAAAAGADAEPARLALLAPPAAAPRPRVLRHEATGDERLDDFYWLRDDARADAAVLAHLEAENAYTRAALADTEALQAALYAEMRGRIQEADATAPVRRAGYWYYSKTLEGEQYRVHCRRRVAPGAPEPAAVAAADAPDAAQPEEVLLDENAEAAAQASDFYMTRGVTVSPDGARLAYGVDATGDETFAGRVRDLATGEELLAAPLEGTAGDFLWAADSATLFYVTKDALDRPHKVWRHAVGGSQADDALVYHEEDEAFYVGLSKTASRRTLLISAGSAVTSDVRALAADNPAGEWTLVLPRVQGVEYDVEDRGEGAGRHLFITLRDAARPNSELLVAPAADPAAARPLLPHRADVKLEHVAVSRDFLVAFERREGLQAAVVYALPPGEAAPGPGALVGGAAIAFDLPAYEMGPGGGGDWASPLLRFHMSSLAAPDTAVDHHMGTGERATKKVAPVKGGFDPSKYVTERLWAPAPDGVQVPISLVYRRELFAADGSAPLLLDAYGSYEICNDPDFRSHRLSLVDRGFVFAIAHVRGGGEMGRAWYEDGKFLKKRNTFTDFVACAEMLIQKKYTSPARLGVEGRSAGGLTIGAALNLRPDLFAAAVLGVPFVDALTTMLDETIPLTVIEREEWGDPREAEFYNYMKSYSPVDNIREGAAYPAVLVTAGLHDPRVGYWEPAKYVAKLRRAAGGPGRPLALLKCELGAGHFSQSGRFDRLKETAVEHAFLLKALGMLGAPLAAP